jgi:hypothetical protein
MVSSSGQGFWGSEAAIQYCPHPDPTRQFVVEVDASDVGEGAILSQRSFQDQKLHPYAFMSHRLNPVNYDIGNWEPLLVKMAREEWRHWLEGEEHLFLVCTAKRFNPRQACWALLFTRFNFTISYRPRVQKREAGRSLPSVQFHCHSLRI